jgi:hypothetical protein
MVVFMICVALPTLADDYAGIQAEQYKNQLLMMTKVYNDVYNKFGYETRLSIWLFVCGQDELSQAVKPDSNALDKFITIKLDEQYWLGKKLTDKERLRALLAIRSMYIGYTLGFKEATFNHYEDLSRINKDASIKAAVKSADKILKQK